MDSYFPEEGEEDTGIGGAQVDEQGAFAFQSDLVAPQGGFSFATRKFPLSSLFRAFIKFDHWGVRADLIFLLGTE